MMDSQEGIFVTAEGDVSVFPLDTNLFLKQLAYRLGAAWNYDVFEKNAVGYLKTDITVYACYGSTLTQKDASGKALLRNEAATRVIKEWGIHNIAAVYGPVLIVGRTSADMKRPIGFTFAERATIVAQLMFKV